jgi:hypothetical protein
MLHRLYKALQIHCRLQHIRTGTLHFLSTRSSWISCTKVYFAMKWRPCSGLPIMPWLLCQVLQYVLRYLLVYDRVFDGLMQSQNYASPATEHHNAGTEATEFAEAHAHFCLATMPCQWTGEDNFETCSAQIACKGVPAHFGDTHGIRKLGRNTMIDCLWEGCLKRVQRKNFARHVRERHLRHPREKKYPSCTEVGQSCTVTTIANNSGSPQAQIHSRQGGIHTDQWIAPIAMPPYLYSYDICNCVLACHTRELSCTTMVRCQ